MPKNLKREDIEIIKTLQSNNPNIMTDLEYIYQMIYIEKSIQIDLNDSSQKAFSELIRTAHYMNIYI